MNTRSVVTEDAPEGESDLKTKIREEMIHKLAGEWNQTHQEIERHSFRSEEERDAEAEYHGEMCDEAGYQAEQTALEKGASPEAAKDAREAAIAAYTQAYHQKEQEKHVRLQVIEELLGELGARMARPYEHWNEEEKYMEYMETRYDNDPDY